MKKNILTIFLFLSAHLSAQIIPNSRTVEWSHAGYESIIPDPSNVIDVTAFGAIGDSVTDNSIPITNAINSLNGFRGVIYFPPGVYRVQSTIILPDSVILRGSSSDSTHLLFDFAGSVGNCINISGSASFPFTQVIAGFFKGSNYLVVADTSGFHSGDYAEIQEDNGVWDTQPISWADQSVGQIIRIDSISGDTLFISSPLRIDYDPSLNIQVRKFIPRSEVGIECLDIRRTDSISTGLCINIYFDHAVNCWIHGIESSRSIGSHIEADASAHIEITGSYVHHSFAYDGTSTHGYGITLFKHTGECKLENNIMKHLRHSFSLQCGANGNVIAYNYSLDPNRSEFPSNLGADISLHGHFSYANLFEGNIVQNIQLDQTWGPSGPFNTFFRNRAELYGILMTSGTVNSDSANFVGNEIPNTGFTLGNYILAGNGHFEYGNNVRGVITPAGTTALTDSSYYLSLSPAFWNISSAWPSIGEPNVSNTGSIPAKERYDSGINLTTCSGTGPTGIIKNDLNEFNIFPNPTNDVVNVTVHMKFKKLKSCLSNAYGEQVICNDNVRLAGENKLTLDMSGLHAGIYFLELCIDNNCFVKKIIKQ